MRSASPLIAAVAVLALMALAGCDTTQRQSARAKLAATRLLTGRKPLLVRTQDPAIRVGRVELVHHDGAAAMVVELHNGSSAPLTDLPISVGLETGAKRRTYLNRRGGLGYFENHVAAIAAGGDATWVFTTRRLKRASGRPFAVVGAPARPPISTAGSLPEIIAAAASPLGPSVRVRLRNAASVPQYGLQVYALARRGTRYVAAGRLTVGHLGSHAAAGVKLRLIGSTRGASLTVQAQPTIFD
ncbi:MAG: hypothetical protein JWM71_1709 [Solirubrobacteraceae bacterium]|nr:hypothetical protein [Solirubrobacteraceae bacterium]